MKSEKPSQSSFSETLEFWLYRLDQVRELLDQSLGSGIAQKAKGTDREELLRQPPLSELIH